MSTALAEGRYAVTEAEETTRDWIAYSVDCPMCGEPAGFRCIYTTGPETAVSAYGRPRDYRYTKMRLKGTMTVHPHYQRVNRALSRARQRALREQRAAARRSAPAPKPAWPVTDKEALEIKCPLCESAPKRKCVRTAAVRKPQTFRGEQVYPKRMVIVHRKGTNIARPHAKRREAYARLRLERWKRENPAEWLRTDMERARAALNAFDRAEYEQMRDWLKNHGAILWGGERPDGSLRGETYAFG
jgi:hypothetical protein